SASGYSSMWRSSEYGIVNNINNYSSSSNTTNNNNSSSSSSSNNNNTRNQSNNFNESNINNTLSTDKTLLTLTERQLRKRGGGSRKVSMKNVSASIVPRYRTSRR